MKRQPSRLLSTLREQLPRLPIITGARARTLLNDKGPSVCLASGVHPGDSVKVDEVGFNIYRNGFIHFQRHVVVETNNRAAVLVHDVAKNEFIILGRLLVPTQGAEIFQDFKELFWHFELVSCELDRLDLAEPRLRHLVKAIGYEVDQLLPVATYFPSPHVCTEQVQLYYAAVHVWDASAMYDLQDEVVAVAKISAQDFFELLDNGEFEDASLIIAGNYGKSLQSSPAAPRAPLRPLSSFVDSSTQALPKPRQILAERFGRSTSAARYAWAGFRTLARQVDWREWRRPSLLKAYLMCMLSELAYEFIPQRELESSGRLKLVPCERYNRALTTGRAISHQVWRSLSAGEGVEEGAGGGFRVRTYEGQLFHSMVFESRDVVFVVFRGTKPFYVGDWRVNLHALPSRAGSAEEDDVPCLFHSGFLLEALRCAELVYAPLKSAIENDIPVCVTGHSLGGAIANIIYTLYAAHRGRLLFGIPLEARLKITDAYAFASPRFGTDGAVGLGILPVVKNGQFAEQPPYNFRDARDPVPHLPPRLLGYRNPHCEYDPQGRPLDVREWHLFPSLRAHSVSRLRRRLAGAIGLDAGWHLLPRRSPEREQVLTRL